VCARNLQPDFLDKGLDCCFQTKNNVVSVINVIRTIFRFGQLASPPKLEFIIDVLWNILQQSTKRVSRTRKCPRQTERPVAAGLGVRWGQLPPGAGGEGAPPPRQERDDFFCCVNKRPFENIYFRFGLSNFFLCMPQLLIIELFHYDCCFTSRWNDHAVTMHLLWCF